MLVNRPSAFIFQQIILPHIANTSRGATHQQRYFSSSSPATRPEVRERESSSSTWEPYASGSRRRTRDFLGLQVDDQPQGLSSDSGSSSSASSKARVGGVAVDEGEAYKRTAALAMERIIQSHQPLPRDRGSEREIGGKSNDKGKGRALEEGITDRKQLDYSESTNLDGSFRGRISDQDQVSPSTTTLETLPSRATYEPQATPQTSAEAELSTRQHPFPPLIHQLLQARQFRLAALHILNLPLYALDEVLVDNVAGFMERHGGGKTAGRLRRGKVPSAEEKRIMSDHDPNQERLPVGHWSLVLSSRPPPRTLDDIEPFMPVIELSKIEKFTAFCNLQLAHLVANDPSLGLGKGLIPPKSLRRPNTTLRQLRDLLARIHRLEVHRGFIPDRVTSNIILSCWIRCSLAPAPHGNRINLSKSGWKLNPKHTPKNKSLGKDELRGLFDTISKLIDRSVLSRDQSLNFQRHVKPFVRMLSRGFKDLGDGEGLKMVEEWEKVVRRVLVERRVEGELGVDDRGKKVHDNKYDGVKSKSK